MRATVPSGREGAVKLRSMSQETCLFTATLAISFEVEESAGP